MATFKKWNDIIWNYTVRKREGYSSTINSLTFSNFPTLICSLLNEERRNYYQTTAKNKEIMFAPKRKLFLNDYVQKVRTELHESRAIEKRERLNQQMQQ